jgi:hypothetical protein
LRFNATVRRHLLLDLPVSYEHCARPRSSFKVNLGQRSLTVAPSGTQANAKLRPSELREQPQQATQLTPQVIQLSRALGFGAGEKPAYETRCLLAYAIFPQMQLASSRRARVFAPSSL